MCPALVFSCWCALQKTQCYRDGDSTRENVGMVLGERHIVIGDDHMTVQSENETVLSSKQVLLCTPWRGASWDTEGEPATALLLLSRLLALKVRVSSFSHKGDRKGHLGHARWLSGEDSSELSNLSSASQMHWVVRRHSLLVYPLAVPRQLHRKVEFRARSSAFSRCCFPF